MCQADLGHKIREGKYKDRLEGASPESGRRCLFISGCRKSDLNFMACPEGLFQMHIM